MNENYFLETSNHEWLLTNKTGGYALGTGNLINQRKYHGLLIAGDEGLNRRHLLAGLEILMEWRGETCFLDSTNYSNCIYPEGFLHLVKSWLRPYPHFLYSTLHHNSDILVKKEIMMADNENTVLIKLTNLGCHSLNFHIRPKLTMRIHHETNPPGIWDNNHIHTEFTENHFWAKHKDMSLCCRIRNGSIKADHVIYRDCYYPWEAIRGYYGVEDQLAPAVISFVLPAGESNYLLFSDSENNILSSNLQKKIELIEKKYREFPLPKDYPHPELKDVPGKDKEEEVKASLLTRLDYNDSIMFEREDYLKILEMSLHDFLIRDDVIAGYPWFGCWGRDTFIYFDALIKSSADHRLCWKVLKKYASLIKNGLIPNMLDESGIGFNYLSIDSTLWFVQAMYNFLIKVEQENLYGKKTIIKDSMKFIEKIISGLLDHQEKHGAPNENKYPFHISEKGLLYLHEEFASATWMDAKVAETAVTPRNGAPVEINALFYNALCCYRELKDRYAGNISRKKDLLNEVNLIINKLSESFDLFRFEGYLADRLIDDLPVKEYRPNALIALSLTFCPIEDTKVIQDFLKTAEREFLTSYGLRTLSPADYRFKRKYLGNQEERDAQYHQGTVWAWLFDPYIKTLYKAYKDEKSSTGLIDQISDIIFNLRNGYMKGHIASAAEVWDGEKPHFPKGCPAQAWSVAALYNAEKLIQRLSSAKGRNTGC